MRYSGMDISMLLMKGGTRFVVVCSKSLKNTPP